jgi:site-specific DNA-methyltransferase (adenine-specific)
MVATQLLTSTTDEWATPQDLFDRLDACFHFTLDPCATDENHKAPKYYTREQDGLKQDWGGEIIWCNPPYGRTIGEWIKRCAEHQGIAVMLIPARTDTRWWHQYIDGNPNASVHFIKGRLKFGGAKNPAPFPSAIVTFTNWRIDK